MPRLWDDKVKNRNPKQLTIFVAPRLNKLWRRAFDDALKMFNSLSTTHQLGVTMAETNTKPDPDGDGGADVQFDMGKGELAYTALGQTTVARAIPARRCTAILNLCPWSSGINPSASIKPLYSCLKRQ